MIFASALDLETVRVMTWQSEHETYFILPLFSCLMESSLVSHTCQRRATHVCIKMNIHFMQLIEVLGG